MAKRKQLRVKMRNSLHGQSIALPRNVSDAEAGAILRQELQQDTPVDKGKAISGWKVKTLSNGDVRVENKVTYIRRLMIDGHSDQARAGAYNDSIRRARKRIIQQGLKNSKKRKKS